MKTYRRILTLLLSLIIAVGAVALCACNRDRNSGDVSLSTPISQDGYSEISSGSGGDTTNSSNDPTSSGEDAEDDKVYFYFVSDASKMHTDLQLAYIADDYSNVSEYANGTKELSKPEPITIRWQTSGKATDCELSISDDEDFQNPLTVPVKSNTIKISNLKTRTKYYFKMKATVRGVTATSDVYTLTTSSISTRFIDCDGVTNMRDLGGYIAKGGVVKQGLIYRCGRLNVSETDSLQVEITENGKKVMRDLGIKSEIDLRLTRVLYANKPEITEVGGLTDTSVLGNDVNYYQCPMEYANGVSSSENYGQVRNIFHYLADKNNYPLIFHCNIGTDRTGYIAYLLNGMLGVSQNELLRDYLFSNFGNIGDSRSVNKIEEYLQAIEECDGTTYREKVENYLKEIVGVPEEDLAAIKEILIEKHDFDDTLIRQATCIENGIIRHVCKDDESLSFDEITFGLHDYENGFCKVCGEEEIVSGVLPSIYTAVDYIESSGTQYIDTGFSPDSNTQVVAKIAFAAVSDGKSHNAFSAAGGVREKEYGFLCNGGKYVTRYGDDKYLDGVQSKNGSFVIDMDKNVLKFDGETVYEHDEKEFACGCSMFVFACNNNGSLKNPAAMRLYSMKIYDNGNLERDFVPVVRKEDDAVGLYDLINCKFYENKGTGEFASGYGEPEEIGEPEEQEEDFDAAYTTLDYIESSGTQYIDTGFSPDSNTRVVATIAFAAVSGSSHNAFSAKGGSREKEYGFLCNGGIYLTRYGDDIYLNDIESKSEPFVVDMDKNVLKFDGETVCEHAEREFACGCSMFVFACNDNGKSIKPATMRLYSMKIYDNGNLVRDFVPVVRKEDDAVGLYDLVNKKFYENNGTGEFASGSVAEES